jgi:hypothetical protein
MFPQDGQSWEPRFDASLPKDLRPIVYTPSNFAVCMGVYPKNAQSESYRFQLN